MPYWRSYNQYAVLSSLLTITSSGGQVPKFRDIIAARNTVQHQLLSLPTSSSGLPRCEECIYDICRFAALIFSDMVLFALPPAAGVKPMLADKLRRGAGLLHCSLVLGTRIHIYFFGLSSWAVSHHGPRQTDFGSLPICMLYLII